MVTVPAPVVVALVCESLQREDRYHGEYGKHQSWSHQLCSSSIAEANQGSSCAAPEAQAVSN
jgi:hypothetical protein